MNMPKSFKTAWESWSPASPARERHQVLVTLQNGTEYVYAKEEKQKDDLLEEKSGEDTVRKQETNDSETKYITIKDADGTQRALAVTEIQPTVKGVVVVWLGRRRPNRTAADHQCGNNRAGYLFQTRLCHKINSNLGGTIL